VVHPRSGVEAIEDGDSPRDLKGSRINEIALAPDGAVWAAGYVGRREGGVYVIRPEVAAATE